ncbi:MAG: hypothetical protein EBT33_12595 [Betaproteobacteria bacterium]|nr:hypothetical protein [Betaproteobacteria bacterium]
MRAVERVTRILQLVSAAAPEGLTLAELSKLCVLDKATVLRITRALCESGWLSKSKSDRAFHLGVEAWLAGRSGHDALNRMARTAVGRLTVLSRDAGGTAYLAVRSGMDMVIVAKAGSGTDIRASASVGQRQTLAAGAAGLAYLSALEPAEGDAMVAALQSMRKAADPDLAEAIMRSRSQGYARSGGSVFYQVRAIALALKGPEGRPIGAVSLAAGAERLTASYIEACLPMLKRTVAGIERSMIRRDSRFTE